MEQDHTKQSLEGEATSSGGRYVDLVQLRSGVNKGASGPINGTLVEGNFTSDFTGRLNVDQMSDLLKLILDGNAMFESKQLTHH